MTRGFLEGVGGTAIALAVLFLIGMALMDHSLDAAEKREVERSHRFLDEHAVTHGKVDSLAKDVDSIKEWTRPSGEQGR